MIFFPSSSSPALAPISMNCWFYVLLYLTSLSPSWSFSAPTSSSFPAASTFIPRRTDPKTWARAAPTSQMLLFSMDLQHSCSCSHHQFHGGRKSVLSVLHYCCVHTESLIYSWQNRDVNAALKKMLERRIFFWSEIIWEWIFSLHNWLFYCVSWYLILAHMSIYIYQHIPYI